MITWKLVSNSGGGPAICTLISLPPGDSDKCSSLRITVVKDTFLKIVFNCLEVTAFNCDFFTNVLKFRLRQTSLNNYMIYFSSVHFEDICEQAIKQSSELQIFILF